MYFVVLGWDSRWRVNNSNLNVDSGGIFTFKSQESFADLALLCMDLFAWVILEVAFNATDGQVTRSSDITHGRR